MRNDKTWYPSHFASLPRYFWYSLAFAGAFFGIYAVCLFSQKDSQFSPTLADTSSTLASLASFVISWIGVKRSAWKQHANSSSLSLPRRLHFWIPLAFSIALLTQGASYAIFVLYDVYTSAASTPIWGEAMNLAMYPSLLIGIFLLPRDTSWGKVPLRFLMESLVLIVAAITFSWYFVLGPTVLQDEGGSSLARTLLGRAFGIGYPTFDLLVISCLILLSRSTADRVLRRAIDVLSLVLLIFVLTDSIMAYQVLQGPPSDWLSLGWMVGDFAIALSLQAMRLRTKSQAYRDVSLPQASAMVATPIWRSLLAYALLPAVIGLVLYIWKIDRTSTLAIGTYVCSLLLLVLVFFNQIVGIQEVHGLNRGFQRLQRIIDERNAALGQANTALGQANDRLEALAMTDPLTELPNHRALVTALDQELARSQQYQRRCSLLFFDVDHFKALNDSYGHAGGDMALREVGSLLRTTLPLVNTIGRWGGEEFVAILPEQNATEATTIAEELRRVVANRSFRIGSGMHLTCSIGIASFPAHATQQEALLQAADSAMYGAKRLGRNQVRVIDDPAVIALLATNLAAEGRDEVALIGTVHALALLVEKRDVATGEHAQRVGELLFHLAQSLSLSETEAQLLSLAGQLHDIGKIVIPDSILQKQEPLTEQELASIQQHAQVGAEVVSSIPSLRPLAPIISAHHEWWDGRGYPNHLAGEEIPLGARLLAIVDAYVAMTTKRPHQDAHEHQWVLQELQRGADTQFDPAIVESFLAMIRTMHRSDEVSLMHHLSTR